MQFVSQNDVVRAVARVTEAISRIKVLKYSKEPRITETGAATRFRSQNSRKSKFNALVLADYSTWDEIVVFCGLIGSKADEHSAVGIPDD